MLYFKTKKGRLIIQIPINEAGNEFIYVLICPKGDRRSYNFVDFTDEEMWKKLTKVSNPKVLEENSDDHAIYLDAEANQEESDQYIAEQEWLMEKAMHGPWSASKKS